MVNKSSFTAASVFPSKLLHTKCINKGKIIPIHIQLILSNKCNLNCKICSYKDRDKNLEMSLKQAKNILRVCKKYGTKSITITGGGEPLLYPQINELIKYASKLDIKVGLVTNGILLGNLKKHKNITWCRISSSDDRYPVFKIIEKAVKLNSKIDWAFSHVLTSKPNFNIIGDLINFANHNKFTHVRIVSDILDLSNASSMEKVKYKLEKLKIDDNLVIYQGRKEYTHGTERCLISLLKPMISPEGIFGCCGVVYAINKNKLKHNNIMKMGDLNEIEEILKNQKYFNGSICDKCYYKDYNLALEILLNKPEHGEFV